MFVDPFSFQKLIKIFFLFWTHPGFAGNFVWLGFGRVCCDLFLPSRKQWFITSRPVKNAVIFVMIFFLPRKSWDNSILGFYFGKSWDNSIGKHPLCFLEPDILFVRICFLKPCKPTGKLVGFWESVQFYQKKNMENDFLSYTWRMFDVHLIFPNWYSYLLFRWLEKVLNIFSQMVGTKWRIHIRGANHFDLQPYAPAKYDKNYHQSFMDSDLGGFNGSPNN